jgi:pyridoxal phosphate enzyme (YggS family)
VNARRDELRGNLFALRERLAAACRAVGREPGEVALLPVTKYFPASDVALLYELGCRDFGESRDQEASSKFVELAQLPDIRPHMIGRLQRNKARSVVRWADTVQSVDSVRLVHALDVAVDAAVEAGERASGPMRVLLQVSLDDDPSRGGVPRAGLLELADAVAGSACLGLAGVMSVAPLGWEPHRAFAELARTHQEMLRFHPAARQRSAGMSADLESAVVYGSTCVRVGTALMGARPLRSP